MNTHLIIVVASLILLVILSLYIRKDHREHRGMVRQINQKFKDYLDSQDSQKAEQLFIANALLDEVKKKMLFDIVDGMPPRGGYTLELTEQEVGMLWSYFDTYHPQPIQGEMVGWTLADTRLKMGAHHRNS